MHLPSPLKTISSILLGTMLAWMLSAFVPDPVGAFFAPHPPTLSFSPAEGFNSTDAINPDTAPVGTPLTFSVVYTHPDNHPPVIVLPVLVEQPGLVRAALAHEDNGEEEAIKLFVNTADGFPFFFDELLLHRDTSSDEDNPLLHNGIYTDGEQFTLTVPAGFPIAATYEFYFQATDGEHWPFFGAPWQGGPLTFTLTAPLPSNHAPTLSFSSETGYTTDGINPDKGTANLTSLTFKAIYTDQDNDPSQNFTLHIDTGTVNLDPIPLIPDTADTVPATLKDGNFTNGEQYTYTSTFPKDQYQYHFIASDGEESARLPTAGELPFQTGYSNVAFLPGHPGSRLVRPDSFCIPGPLTGDCIDQLWEPTNFNEDVKNLSLKADGTSMDPTVHTTEVIRKALRTFDDVYDSFLNLLESLKNDGTINDWEAIPYDWRMPLEDIVDNGIQTDSGLVYLQDEIRNLAASSANGKVTLIGHSNGGLLGKVLIERLKDTNEDSLIDRFILVASPQLGTPKAIGAVLHGDNDDFCKYGLCLVSRPVLRSFAENMASAYNLMPSLQYFSVINTVSQPIIEFDPSMDASVFSGPTTNIGSASDFYDFLGGIAAYARLKPEDWNTDQPNVANSQLLSGAQMTHGVLDTWMPPSHMKVVQVVGWGLPTIRGLRYFTKTVYPSPVTYAPCFFYPPACAPKTILDHKPLTTVEVIR